VGYTGCPWGHSLPEDSQMRGSLTYTYQSVLRELLRGAPIGSAFQYLNQNFAEMSVNLIELRENIEFGMKYQASEVHSLWAISQDAANAIILGDPAVRLNVFEHTQNFTVQRPVLSSLTSAVKDLTQADINYEILGGTSAGSIIVYQRRHLYAGSKHQNQRGHESMVVSQQEVSGTPLRDWKRGPCEIRGDNPRHCQPLCRPAGL
jgi:hypothetical protein